MRVCVIGGGGFIGKYLVEILCKTGRDVVVLGRSIKRPEDLYPDARYIQCDYASSDELKSALHGAGEIIDLAYATVPKTSFTNPIFDLQSNLTPALNLLVESRELSNLKRLVIVSSGGRSTDQ